MQHENECLFFVADLHSLVTRNANPELIEKTTEQMIIDWLACGIDPAQATIFIQSKIPEHTEIFTLLSMITPINWFSKINNLGWKADIKLNTGIALAYDWYTENLK